MFDVIFNLAFFMVLVGGIVFMVSFAGCIGALRENMCFLKLYSICLLLFFLAEMALAALGEIKKKAIYLWFCYLDDSVVSNVVYVD